MLTRNPLELFLLGGVQVDKLFGKIDLMDLDKAMIELASKKTSFVAKTRRKPKSVTT
jgi:hypothetical protein